MVRNGIRTFSGNFMLVFKHLVYLLIIGGVSLALFLWSFEPVVNRLTDSGWIGELYEFLEVFYTNPLGVADAFEMLATKLYLALFSDIGSIWGSYALSLFALLVLPNFLYNIGEYTLGVLTHSRMSSLLNRSYASTMLSSLARSTRYALIKLLFNIPFFAISVGVCVGYGILANTFSGAWVLLPIFIAVIMLVLAFRYVFFIGFLPVSVISEGALFKSFANGLDLYTEGFMKKVLAMWALFIVELALSVAIALFTLGAGLVIAVPSLLLVNVACSFTNYFQTNKENFYVGENQIVKPL